MSYLWGAERAGASLETAASARDLRLAGTASAETNLGCWAAAGPAPPGLDMWRLASELAPMVILWRRLLAEHVPDPARRCRTCTKGGTGLPCTPWPCPLYGIANMARRSYEGTQS